MNMVLGAEYIEGFLFVNHQKTKLVTFVIGFLSICQASILKQYCSFLYMAFLDRVRVQIESR